MTKMHYRPYNPNQTMLFPQSIDEEIAEKIRCTWLMPWLRA